MLGQKFLICSLNQKPYRARSHQDRMWTLLVLTASCGHWCFLRVMGWFPGTFRCFLKAYQSPRVLAWWISSLFSRCRAGPEKLLYLRARFSAADLQTSLLSGNSLDHHLPSFYFSLAWKLWNIQCTHKALVAKRAGFRASPHVIWV